MSRILHDITIPVAEGLAVWPGDQEYQLRFGWSMAEGATVNVGTVTMSVHTGTHTDAPLHFAAGGASIGELPMAAFFGPAVVVDVTGESVIGWEHFAALDFAVAPRLLLKTGTWTDHAIFPASVPTLAPDVPARLAQAGVLLFGVDVPSVDAIDSTDLPIHQALNRGNIRILESLDLRAVPGGRYTLIAFPLRLIGSDASPVRAVLVEYEKHG